MSRSPFRRAGIDDFPPGEYPALRELLAGIHIARACLRQPRFEEHAAMVNAAPDRLNTAYGLAPLYAILSRPGLLVMTHLLLAAGDAPAGHLAAWVEVIWADLSLSLAVIACDPATRADARRYFPGAVTIAQFERGSELLARRGADRCLVPGCEAERTRAQVRSGAERVGAKRVWLQYCEAHADPLDGQPRAKQPNKRDARIIETTFAAAAAALPRLGDQLRALDALRTNFNPPVVEPSLALAA
jgi:hypothetical protein